MASKMEITRVDNHNFNGVIVIFGLTLVFALLQQRKVPLVSYLGRNNHISWTGNSGDQQQPTKRTGLQSKSDFNSSQNLCDATVRSRLLQSACEKQGREFGGSTSMAWIQNHHKFLVNIAVDDRHKVLFCPIPKVASTTFDALLVSSAGNISIETIQKRQNVMHYVHWRELQAQNGVRRLNTYKPGEVKYRLENYFKFIAVRHPYDRLVSAWRDKSENHVSYGTFWHPNAKQLDRFTDFVTGVAQEGHPSSGHWKTYHRFCHVCDIAYDSILKLETLHNDLPPILAKLPGPNGKPTVLPSLNQMSPFSPMAKLRKLSEYYENISGKILRQLRRKYALDFALFGYNWDMERKHATCEYKSTVADAVKETCIC